MTFTELHTESLDGTPVWHLRGVTLENMPAVLRTNAWIHYSDLGDEGWGLVAHAVQAAAWRGQLARLGVEIEPWPTLPIKPWERRFIITMGAVFVASFLTFFGAFIMAGVWGYIRYRHKKRIRHIRIAPGLRKVLEWTSIKDNYAYTPVRVEGE